MNETTREDVLRFFTRRAVEDLKAAAIGMRCSNASLLNRQLRNRHVSRRP